MGKKVQKKRGRRYSVFLSVMLLQSKMVTLDVQKILIQTCEYDQVV